VGDGGRRFARVAIHLGPHAPLVGAAQHLGAQSGRGKAALALELAPALVPAAGLHAVDAHRARPGQRRQQQVLAQHAVLLSSHQDLAGEEQRMRLAAIVHHEIRHARLVALGDGELAAPARLVKGGDLERHARAAVQPVDEELAVGLRRPDPDVAGESPEVGARLAAPGVQIFLGGVGQEAARSLRLRHPRSHCRQTAQGQHAQHRASGPVHVSSLLRARGKPPVGPATIGPGPGGEVPAESGRLDAREGVVR
jgi:hypothetical protein